MSGGNFCPYCPEIPTRSLAMHTGQILRQSAQYTLEKLSAVCCKAEGACHPVVRVHLSKTGKQAGPSGRDDAKIR